MREATEERIFNKGDVYYLYPTPFEDEEDRRDGKPVVVMGSEKGIVTVVYLSGNTSFREKDAVWIRSVHRKCQAKYKSVTTVPEKNMGNLMTHISVPEMMALDAAIKRHLGLSDLMGGTKMETVKDTADTTELAAVKAERDVYKQMYERLLSKMLGDD